MSDNNPKIDPKSDSKPRVRPPPLPPPRPATAQPSLFARVKAFVAIRRIRTADAARRLWGGIRRHPIASTIAAGAVVAVLAAGGYVAVNGPPEFALLASKSYSDAEANARARPNDAAAQRDHGHALFARKKRHAALASYGRALDLDASIADDRMVHNLLASFGHAEQHEAEGLIWKHKVAAAAPGLEKLVRSKHHGVRWGAVHTLDKLEKGTKANWETAYILDLDSPDCDVRRAAVEKLGAIGSKRAVSALRAAKADDEKTGGWFRSRCLGDRLDDAEQRILARR